MNASLRHLLLVAVFAISPLVHAEIGGLEDVPAATLLLPYFEVDLDNPLGLTTLFSVSNARQEATLAHVTLWTDLGVPTLDFNVYLTGYDIQTFNLRDLFTTGITPQTAPASQDPGDTISPQGEFSTDVNFPSCAGQLPLPTLPATLITHLRNAHTGKGSSIFSGLCASAKFNDNVARGYLTIDQVDSCTLSFPTDADYYDAGNLGFDNTLVGDYFYVDSDQNFAQGETMVHLEADPELGAANYTFYRTLSGGADKREGMGNVFLARFADGGAFDGGTDLVAWRDSKRLVQPFSCGLDYPAPFPLGQEQVVVFDEEENVDVPFICPFECPPGSDEFRVFPLHSNRVTVNGPELPVPWSFGAWYLNLGHSVSGSQVPFGPLAQAFVTLVLSANNRFSVGYDAYQLSNVTVPAEAVDGFIPTCDGAPDPPACL